MKNKIGGIPILTNTMKIKRAVADKYFAQIVKKIMMIDESKYSEDSVNVSLPTDIEDAYTESQVSTR